MKNILYFDNGAASQYNNRLFFDNLVNHKNNFVTAAQWQFFDTHYGKGPCDAAGSTKNGRQ
jgi:hypothetical protein